jgi:4-carboxymuconolactone decarboxylase
LTVPAIAKPAQSLGRACRYGTSLTRRESELVILLTGAKFRSHAEFDIHVREALKEGLSMSVIRAIPRDNDFSFCNVMRQVVPLLRRRETTTISSTSKHAHDNIHLVREEAIVKFTAELLDTSTVSDDSYAATKRACCTGPDPDRNTGDKVIVEITSIIGYYAYVAYTLNVFRLPSKSDNC